MSYAKASSSRSQATFIPNGGEPEPQPSLPPSPVDEQDLAGASLQSNVEDSDDRGRTSLNSNASRKGKMRATVLDVDDADANEWEVEPPDGDVNDSGGPVSSHYPPTKEEEEESRKIEENLRRWEHAERQRRRAAREREKTESVSSTNRTSVVGDISQRASLLWNTHKRKPTLNNAPPPRNQGHTALRSSSEDALPLGELNGGARSPLYSPEPATPTPDADRSASLELASLTSPKLRAPIPTAVENPFEPPGISGAGDEESGNSAVMSPSSPPPPTPAGSRQQEKSPFDDPLTLTPEAEDGRPTLQATSSFSGPGSHPLAQLPPPMPLDLPPPKTPPPLGRAPKPVLKLHQPAATSSPNAGAGQVQEVQEEDKRWWTDWLCGCRESGRDNQAGRTNPFE